MHSHARPSSGFRRYVVFGILTAFLLTALAWCSGGSRILLGKNLLTVPWPSSIDLAGEPVPLDDFYVREAWEKEFLVNLDQDYQNLLYLKRSAKYFPEIERKLAEHDLPDDLKYLAVAESGLREQASSSAGAAGIWQFIPATARQYGLRVDDEIDERHDFDKSTDAAIDYLTKLYRQFGSWSLAAAAYNRGENGLARDMQRQQVNDYYHLYLNSETARYVFRILAIKQIMADAAEYGYDLGADDYFVWPDTHDIAVSESVPDLARFAVEHDSNLRTLKELNPWIVGNTLPRGAWHVRLPN